MLFTTKVMVSESRGAQLVAFAWAPNDSATWAQGGHSGKQVVLAEGSRVAASSPILPSHQKAISESALDYYVTTSILLPINGLITLRPLDGYNHEARIDIQEGPFTQLTISTALRLSTNNTFVCE